MNIHTANDHLAQLRAIEAAWRLHRESLPATGDDNTIASGEYQACQAIIAALSQAVTVLVRDHHRAQG